MQTFGMYVQTENFFNRRAKQFFTDVEKKMTQQTEPNSKKSHLFA